MIVSKVIKNLGSNHSRVMNIIHINIFSANPSLPMFIIIFPSHSFKGENQRPAEPGLPEDGMAQISV